MKILLITDIHYGENTNYIKQSGENWVNSFGEDFKNYIPKLREAIKEHDLVIFLGDLIHDESNKEDKKRYKAAMNLLNTKVPVKYVIGNHDLKFLSQGELTDILQEDNIYYSFDQDGFHHVVLDANKKGIEDPKTELPMIDLEQIKWLQEDLRKTDLPTMVYSHFPIDDQNLEKNYYFSYRPEQAFTKNKVDIRKILEESGKVIGVFSGHLHFFSQSLINGITYVTVPSFTENDGAHKAIAEYVSITIHKKDVSVNLKKIKI